MAQAQQQQPPVEQEFIPQYNKEQTRALIDAYNKNPHLYKGYLPAIQNHSQYHNVPFYEGDFSILEAIRQAAGGLVEGFSTLNVVKDAPDNEWTAVARSVGHLVGFAPGILSHPLSKIKSLQGLSKMLQGARGQKGVQASGGFAGSGQQQQFTSGIKDVYGKGMTDVLAQTGQQRAQSLKSVQDMINQWQSQALQVKGYQ